MSRSATADTLKRLARPSGEAPLPVVKLYIGTKVYWFSDRDLDQDGLHLDGRIITIGDLDMDVKVDRQSRIVGSVGVISVKLLDEDQALLRLMDANDLQGCKVEVYHWYEGQVQADLMLLLKGRIESPPVWHEDDRTLSFVAETPRRLRSIPFSPSEADGLAVDLDHLGKEWPMAFGTPSDVPAVLIKDPPRGTTTRDITEIGDLEEITAFGGIFSQHHATNVFLIDNPDEDFPQGVECLVKIADEYVLGSFTGNTLTVTRRQVNKYSGLAVSGNCAQITVPAGVRAVGSYIIVRPIGSVYRDPRSPEEIEGLTALAMTPFLASADSGTSSFIGYVYKQVGRVCYTMNGNPSVPIENAVADVNRYPFTPEQGAQWVHKAGSPVVVQSVRPIYVVNQLPSTSVVRVRAWRQVTHDDHTGFAQRQLVTVPRSIYTVNLNDSRYNGATTITLTEMLQDREAGWENELFVTVVSSQGSNTADAIKYLIDNQSEGKLTSDPTSFAYVRYQLVKYPSNFAITRQADVLDVCGDIAWQARCGIRWDGARASIVYLSAEPATSAIGLTDSIVAEGSIDLTTTSIENVVTVFSVTWKPNYSDVKPKRLLYRTNMDRYGKREQTFDFWIYQQRSLVVKSAAFWAGRMGRIWRMADDETWGLEGLPVTVLDYAKWAIPDFYTTVKGLVLNASHKDDHVSLSALLPIESGQTTQSSHFWVSDASDTAPASRDYSGDAADLEYVQTPPPEEINPALKNPEESQDTAAVEQIFNVIAVQPENRDPASLEWKQVWVRVLDPLELSTQKHLDSLNARIAQIDFLDPGHVNYTLNLELYQLNIDKATDEATLLRLRPSLNPLLPAGINGAFQAHNYSVSYMQTGDLGTMLVQNGEYIVTPTGSTGPFVAKVTKPPASPAEGRLYADTSMSIPTPAGEDTKVIKVLGDGTGLKIGDPILVFRDANGDYYTPGGGGSGSVGMARVLSNSADKTHIPIGVYLTAALAGEPDITTTGIMPVLADHVAVPAGTWTLAVKLGESWVLQVPVYVSYVPA